MNYHRAIIGCSSRYLLPARSKTLSARATSNLPFPRQQLPPVKRTFFDEYNPHLNGSIRQRSWSFPPSPSRHGSYRTDDDDVQLRGLGAAGAWEAPAVGFAMIVGVSAYACSSEQEQPISDLSNKSLGGPSRGSIGHPDRCNAFCRFFQGTGCNHGHECNGCHEPGCSNKRKPPKPSKKDRNRRQIVELSEE